MNRCFRALGSLMLAVAFTSAVFAARSSESSPAEQPQLAEFGPEVVITSNGRAGFAKAGSDTFCLYGGPGSLNGKFQDSSGTPDEQGWESVDQTDQPTLWQAHTFNSPTGSMSMWAGQTAAQNPGWDTAPGYGNSWNALLRYAETVADPSLGQTVGLSFTFNHDSEPGYDYFVVDYDSAGSWQTVLSLDGNNKDSSGNFVPVSFPTGAEQRTITFGGNDYGGVSGDEILIQMRAASDGAWSDEDGLFPSDGLAQVDDITVSSSGGAAFEDFEGGAPYAWNPVAAPYAGNFGKVFGRVEDLDVCRDNLTPVLGFIDDGTPPSNPRYAGPGFGTTSDNWSYGIPGGWVVNYNGGVSLGLLNVTNHYTSPEIPWDLPGTTDDGVEVAGAFFRVSVYEHLPLFNGMCFSWDVRGRESETGLWTNWASRNFFYYSHTPRWRNSQQEVSDLLPVSPESVQFRLSVRDVATIFAFPGTDATPAPLFDNAAFFKYTVGGPTFATRTIDLFQDSFAQSGATSLVDATARDDHDIRIDMARDVSTGQLNMPGDSIIVDITSVIPGVDISDSLAQISMVYSLNMNPVFESSLRANAPVTDPGAGLNGWDQHEGSIAPYQSTTSNGLPVSDRYAFDFPDADFMYPGDILEYYIEATDDAGNTSTLPASLNGFDDPSVMYDRRQTVRALPTYRSDGQGGYTQPSVLFWNDFGRRGGEEEALSAFAQNGFIEGDHYDSYTTQGPSSLVSNGLGSSGAHGATADQLFGYDCIVYESGDLSAGLISDGSNSGLNDKGDDIGVLTTWFDEAGADRTIIHFGDSLADFLDNQFGSTYLSDVMGVVFQGWDVSPNIGDQVAPRVVPSGDVTQFATNFVAYGGCLDINRFDDIRPGPQSVASHEWVLPSGQSATGSFAGVVHDRVLPTSERKLSVSFPFGMVYVYGDGPAPGGVSARAALLGEAFALANAAHVSGPAVSTSLPQPFTLHPNAPNPFNPATTLSFTLGHASVGRVDIYNLRGELVRTLVDGALPAGPHAVQWHGDDQHGATVASGVYVARFEFAGLRQQQKIALVK